MVIIGLHINVSKPDDKIRPILLSYRDWQHVGTARTANTQTISKIGHEWRSTILTKLQTPHVDQRNAVTVNLKSVLSININEMLRRHRGIARLQFPFLRQIILLFLSLLIRGGWFFREVSRPETVGLIYCTGQSLHWNDEKYDELQLYMG